jgi:very-short-patch-repair endonuclease
MPTQRDQPDLRQLAEQCAGVVRLEDLRVEGVTRGRRRAQVKAQRWRSVPRRGAVLHQGEVTHEAAWRLALLQIGASARLGGVTALQSHGLTGYDEALVHVWVPKGFEKAEVPGVKLHETRRWTASDVMPSGLPRSTPEVATVQAALWARSLRQAMLCLVMPIQQRLVRVEDVAVELDRIKRHRFRQGLRAAIHDIADGAQSLNELDFARECRRRGLPEPSRQLVRQTSQGRIYLDVRWEPYGVVVEVNGAGHNRLDVAMRDEVRIADLQTTGDAVVPLSVLTLRADPEPVFASIRRLLESRGWRQACAASE